MQKTHWMVYAAILGGILAVSTASIFIRFAQTEAPSLVIAALRLTIASLALAPLALTRHRAELAGLTRRELALGLLAGIFLALHFATWISSLEFTSVASSVVLVTTTPLWVALLAPLALKETLSRGIWLGLGLALAGGALAALSQTTISSGLAAFWQGRTLWGNFLALSGAWAGAGYLLIGRSLRARLSLIAYIFVVYGMAALVLLAMTAAAGQTLLGYPPLTYVWMAALALVPQLLGHSAFNWALGHLPASLVSITLLGEPLGSILLAFFILKESPSGLELLGGALILVGILLASAQPPAQAKAGQ